MVQELPRQQENDASEVRNLNYTPEAPRPETPAWPVNRSEEDNRRDIMSRYPTQDTASPFLPAFRGKFGSADARFEGLLKGSQMFTAESLGLSSNVGKGGASDSPDVANLGARRLQSSQLRALANDAPPAQSANLGSLADMLSEIPSGADKTKSQPAKGQEGAEDQLRNLFDKIKPGAADPKEKTDETKPKAETKGDVTESDNKTDKPAAEPKNIKLDYPGGKKSLDAKVDKDGNLTEFNLKDEHGEANFYKDDMGRWIKTDRFGVESIVNGKFDLRNGNELVYKKPNGEVQVHKADGSVAKGRELSDGSTVDLDDSGKKATALNRKDGSKVEATYDKNDLTKVVETSKDGNQRTTWSKDKEGLWTGKSESKDKEGKWADDGKAPNGERRNLELNVNGKYSYEDKLEFKHVINGDGSERIEPKLTANKDGTKTVEIQYPDGKGFRTLTLDKDNKLTKFTEKDEDGSRSYFKDKQGDWHMKAGLKNVKVGGDFKLEKNGDFVSRDGDRYDIQRLDGSVIHEKVNGNGSRIRFNDDNSISKVSRKDGSVVDVNYENGEKKQVVDTNKDESARTIWSKNDKGTWSSEGQVKDKDGKWVGDGKPSTERKDVEVNQQGLTIATDVRGFKHVTGADGSKMNEGANGSKFTFDDKGRIESITYGPGANRQFKFQYDASDNISKVDINDRTGKLLESRSRVGEDKWKVTKADGSDGGTWDGKMKLSPEGNFMQQDSKKDRESGNWQVITPGYDKYTERTDGNRVTRTYADKSEVQSEKLANGDERVTKITRGKESREFRYDGNGKLNEVVDTTAKGTNSWKPEGDKVKVYQNGDVAYEKNDGSAVIKKGDFSTVELDKDGDVRKVTTKDGKSRSFEYDNVKDKKELVKITDTRPTKDGEKSEVWTRKLNGDGSVSDQFVSPGVGGKEKVRTGVEVLQDGDYKYKGNDGKDRVSKVGKDGTEGGFSASVDEARDRLKEAMDTHLDDARKARLDNFMKTLEKRAQDRVEAMTAAGIDKDKATEGWEQKLAKTYDHLAEMMEQNPSAATYDQKTRAKLVENFMYIAADTTQGSQDVGNCWEMCNRNLMGMTKNPDAMARMLKEISLTGGFNAVHGGLKSNNGLDRRSGDLDAPKRFDLPKNMLQLDAANANWSLDKPNEPHWQGGTGTMPSSPVGYILDNAIGFMGGRNSHNALSGGTWESFPSPSGNAKDGWYYGINELMYMATGEQTPACVRVSDNSIAQGDISRLTDKALQKQLLENGGALVVGPGHMFAVKLVKNDGQWQIVSDNQWGPKNDQVVGKLTDLKAWDVKQTREQYKPGGQVRVNNDTPVGPVNPNVPVRPNAPNGPDRPRPYNPYQPRQYEPEPRPVNPVNPPKPYDPGKIDDINPPKPPKPPEPPSKPRDNDEDDIGSPGPGAGSAGPSRGGRRRFFSGRSRRW
jgi:hypothetical protein